MSLSGLSMDCRSGNQAISTQHHNTQSRQGVSDFLAERDRYWPINNSIFENLGPVEHAALRRTSRRHAIAINSAQEVYHGINKHLSKFVTNPIDFRCLQAKHNALITAPFSTQYMTLALSKHNGEIKTDILTMMFEKNTGEEDISKLLTADGYEIQTQYSHLPEGVQLFTRDSGNTGFTRVMLIFLPPPPIYSLLRSVGFTCDANVITWNKTYALFAHATFASKETYMLQPCSDLSGIFNDSEDELQLKHLDEPWFDTPSITGPRSVGDNHTMKEILDVNNIWPSKMSDYVFESAKFKLELVPKTRWEQMQYYRVQTYQLKHPVLQHPHLHLGPFADAETQSFIKWFEERLDHVTCTEMMKIPSSLQTHAVMRVINDPKNAQQSRGKFTLPRTWIFVDNEVIKKFRQFEESRREQTTKHMS